MLAGLLLGALTLLPVSARTSVVLQAPRAVTIQWDASADARTVGYRVHWGGAPGVYVQDADAGNALTWTSPPLDGQQFFAVTSYDSGGLDGSYSNEVADPSVIVVPGDCDPPLGAHAVSIFITKLENTTGSVGSQARLNFQLGSPNSPITALTVQVDGVTVDQPVTGANLTKTGGIWFTTPSVAGTYPVTLTAANAAACTTIATKDALGNPLTVTVK